MAALVELPCAARDALQVVKKNWPAVLPHAPNDYTTSGAHFQPSSEQMVSLNVCSLSSVCLDAAPETTPLLTKCLI